MDASYYQHTPPPSHHPYYYQPPAENPPPPYFHSQHPPLPPPASHYALPHNTPPPASHYALPHNTPPPLPHNDEVRTLFIAGLPDDCMSREIYNLFRDFPGYQSSYLRGTTESSHPYAFAIFANQQCAVDAMNALNGFVFDMENDSTLYIELARSNSKSSKRLRKGVGSNVHMPGMGSSAYSTHDYSATESHARLDSADPLEVEPKKPTASRTHTPQNNPACPTLFLANLRPAISEQELTRNFCKFPGFLKLMLQKKRGVSVAFVDFQDIASSTEALNSLKETTQYSSFGERLRVEYSKSRMGLRRRDR